ncbi:MAG: GFA family protein [Minwuia sp.]|uniref:GFA family protein n=1 Tax=Minwuia sp. TaxID=2493630 RepID=UPI003A879A4C
MIGNRPPPYEGGCACGAVRYRITAETLGSRACHCRICQQVTAAPYLAQAQFAERAITWTGATSVWASSPRLRRHFCPVCGTHLFLEPRDAPRIGVPLATLDDPEAIRPEMHYWTASALSWAPIPGDVPCFAEASPTPYREP